MNPLKTKTWIINLILLLISIIMSELSFYIAKILRVNILFLGYIDMALFTVIMGLLSYELYLIFRTGIKQAKQTPSLSSTSGNIVNNVFMAYIIYAFLAVLLYAIFDLVIIFSGLLRSLPMLITYLVLSPFLFISCFLLSDFILYTTYSMFGKPHFWPGRGVKVIHIDESLGFVFGGFTFIIALIGGSDDVRELIYNHEMHHVRARHNIKLLFTVSLIAIPMNLAALLFLHSLSITTINEIPLINLQPEITVLLFIAIFALAIMVLRILEIHADYAVHKVMGSRAWDVFTKFYNEVFPRFPTWRRFISRLTHTGRRDLVLKFGDPIAPHAPWEFPLVFSLLSSTPVFLFLYTVLSHVLSGKVPTWFLNYYLPPIIIGLGILGLFVIIYLFGLVLRPIIRLVAKPKLLSRGITNLSLLISGVYFLFASLNLLTLLVSTYAAIALFMIEAVINYLIIRHYVGQRALITTVVTYVIFTAMNALMLVRLWLI